MSGDRERAIRTGWEANVSPGFAADETRTRPFTPDRWAAGAVPVIMAQMQAITAHDTSARLPELALPTLVVHGTTIRCSRCITAA